MCVVNFLRTEVAGIFPAYCQSLVSVVPLGRGCEYWASFRIPQVNSAVGTGLATDLLDMLNEVISLLFLVTSLILLQMF